MTTFGSQWGEMSCHDSLKIGIVVLTLLYAGPSILTPLLYAASLNMVGMEGHRQ